MHIMLIDEAIINESEPIIARIRKEYHLLFAAARISSKTLRYLVILLDSHVTGTIVAPSSELIPNTSNQAIYWYNTHGVALAKSIVHAGRTHSSLTLVVTPDTATAIKLEREVRALEPSLEVLHFADRETLPFDSFSPHEDITSSRLQLLSALPNVEQAVLIVSVSTLLYRLPPTDYIAGNTFDFKESQTLDVDKFRLQLEQNGYHAVDTVYEHGEFAIRGSLIDLYPMGHKHPVRLDLFDDEIDSIRVFDPESQRSQGKLTEFKLLPAREVPINQRGISAFRNNWYNFFDNDHRNCPIYQDVSGGIAPAGIEFYLPLFFDEPATLFDYLPEQSALIQLPAIEGACDQLWNDINDRHTNYSVDIKRPLVKPQDLFLSTVDIFAQFKKLPRALITHKDYTGIGYNAGAAPLPDLRFNIRDDNPKKSLHTFIANNANTRILFSAESQGREQVLLEELSGDLEIKRVSSFNEFENSDSNYCLLVAHFDDGCVLSNPNIAVIPETALHGHIAKVDAKRSRASIDPDTIIRNLTELSMGAPVIHLEHGIGRYRGLETITASGEAQEFLTIEYADEAKLYVPVTSLNLISRYTAGEEGFAPLHRLGTEQWSEAKRKAAEKARDAAAELLDIYARRAARQGHAHKIDTEANQQFAASFRFELTADQKATIEAIEQDMAQPKPMDRLVCGDVGFGKTEVAMRAAFLSVHNQKQVVLLVPTTLLAQQHYESFLDRFADWPVNIEVVSRFKTAKQQEQILDRMKTGAIDILIGTHKLLHANLNQEHLGLLIVDEEHRFGVKQKETIKALRANVDILTLTATPIPRTLNMSMAGIRDLSIIATPPAKRLSVKTFVRGSDKAIIKEAILRELLRGGQVFYLHNEVKTIEQTASELEELIPEAKVGIGHGQMTERSLEQVMNDFYHHRFNVLVATTIIETGIDIPNANTIIIDRADKFGLAQLHQLRGRVGRSHHQAYAYMLTNPEKRLTRDAEKRLEAIESAQELGAGFTLATHDLEIRGAGELLGDEQSGQIHGVGFALYSEMLERAIKSIRKGETPNIDEPLQPITEVSLKVPALIPDDYIPDIHTRLILYKRISSETTTDGLKDLKIEMIDRFGLLPDSVNNLFEVTRIKAQSANMGIEKIDAGMSGGFIEFHPTTTIDPMKLIKLVQTQPGKFKMTKGTRLGFTIDSNDPEKLFSNIDQLLKELG